MLARRKYASQTRDSPRRAACDSRRAARAVRQRPDEGRIHIEVPRDRDGSFEPLLIPQHERRFTGFDEKIVAKYAWGMTVRETFFDALRVKICEDAVVHTRPPLLTEWQLVATPAGRSSSQRRHRSTVEPCQFRCQRPKQRHSPNHRKPCIIAGSAGVV